MGGEEAGSSGSSQPLSTGDQDDQTRAFAKEFYSATNNVPPMAQAEMYSATIHYLNAVQASGTTDGDKVMEKMRATPIRDLSHWPRVTVRSSRSSAYRAVATCRTST
ncbi:ABC transporter substrate-binding protein [Caballeronia udeis]|uniref:ABC transporter substrate-binding protein n=1 Tax=Caballeronia udeis TaxID=1232866 RepID=UPI00094F65A0